MWESLANDPWPIFGVLFALAILAAWWSRRSNSKSAFVVGVVLLIAAVVPLFAGLFVDTPVKQIDRIVQELVAAGEARDHRKIVAALDPDYNYAGLTKEKLAKLIERELTQFRPDYVSVSHLVIDTKKTAGGSETATAGFVATTGGRYEGEGMAVSIPRYFIKLKLHFVKRDGGWRIVEIHRYDPQLTQEQEIQLGHH
jgi:hypothetical protein